LLLLAPQQQVWQLQQAYHPLPPVQLLLLTPPQLECQSSQLPHSVALLLLLPQLQLLRSSCCCEVLQLPSACLEWPCCQLVLLLLLLQCQRPAQHHMTPLQQLLLLLQPQRKLQHQRLLLLPHQHQPAGSEPALVQRPAQHQCRLKTQEKHLQLLLVWRPQCLLLLLLQVLQQQVQGLRQ
jgi:hypothetical protein